MDFSKVECMQSVIGSLTKEYKFQRLKCLVNSDGSMLCLINPMAPSVVQFHFYCIPTRVKAVDFISMLKYLYFQWKNGSDELYASKKWVRVFLDYDFVSKDKQLRALFEPFNWSAILLSNDNDYYV